MKAPEIPDNETERQQALDNTGLLAGGPEERFDRITRLACHTFSVPIALVSLIDRDRQWFKSRQGLDATETPRDISFCGHTIHQSEPMIIEDALEDERFSDNPLVTSAPDIRFYAGAPLHTDTGHRLGTLCLIDRQPRSFDDTQIALLRELAGMVEDLIRADAHQRRRTTEMENQLRASHDEMASLLNNMPGVTFRCLPDEHWTMLYMSRQVEAVSGYTTDDLIGNKHISYAELIHSDDAPKIDEAVTKAMTENTQWHIEYRIRHRTSGWRWVEERGRCIRDDPQYPVVLEGFIVDITREHDALQQLEYNHTALMLLNDIAFSTHRSLDDKIDHALQEARHYLGSDLAILSQIEGDTYTLAWVDASDGIPVAAGQQFALGDTWCSLLMSSANDGPTREYFIPDTDRPEYRAHPCYEANPLGSYAGMVVEVDGHPWGTLNLSTVRARQEDYEESEKLFLRLLANWVSEVLTNSLGHDRLTKLMAQLPGSVYQFRRFPDGTMVFPFSSPQVEDLYGITPEQAAEDATPAFERIHPDDLAAVSASIEDSARTLENWAINYRVAHPRHGYRWVSGHAKPERLLDGSIQWYGYIQDIHEQQQARLALEQSEARLRGLFEFSPIGIALNDFETGRFIDLNHALVVPTGYTAEEFVELSYWDVTPKEYLPEEEKALADLRKTGRYGPFEKEYMRKDGSRYPVRLQGMISEEIDGRNVIWSLVEDISERKKLDRMKDQFISTVSHELRTPLTSIKGSLGLLAGGAAGELPDKAQKLLETAGRNTSRLMLLINDLLDMEKLVAGKMSMVPQKQALAPILDEAIESVREYRNSHSVRIAPPQAWPAIMVNVDSQRLVQALTNLLSNAIKFSPENSPVEVSVIEQDETAEIRIRDHGPGVSPEFQERLFQRFSQADATDSRKLPGTGLGLAITREICQQLGGEVGYRDAKGGGAEFYIQLPVIES
ncbi:PAS domain-containing protein [Marinimicrobium locisalis]|uniref:PAS domain-containing protein n=1 Tax=Marinimicrobium locisalis TaxID=546022 RepID=UPI003221D32B